MSKNNYSWIKGRFSSQFFIGVSIEKGRETSKKKKVRQKMYVRLLVVKGRGIEESCLQNMF
jgi:hypothetical protein